MTGETDLGIDGIANVRLLDSGGFADVYEARDEFGRRVAIKVLKALDDAARRRFDRERSVMGMVAGHPHIVNPFTSGYTSTDGKPYVVMEFLGGGSLQQWVSRHGPMPLTSAVTLIEGIADALDASHRAGIIHKDVKPANILLTDEGTAKLADFGIASIRDVTTTTAPAYSPAYSPPETFSASAEGDPRDERSDLYSLAATLFATVSGRDPFLTGSESAAGAMVRILNEPPPQTGYPDLDRFLTIAMAKDPVHRYQTASDFVEALRSVDMRSPRPIGDTTPTAPAGWPGDAPGPTPPTPASPSSGLGPAPGTAIPAPPTQGRHGHNAATMPAWAPPAAGHAPAGRAEVGRFGVDSVRADGAGDRASKTPWLIAGAVVAALALLGAAVFAVTRSDTTGTAGDSTDTQPTASTTDATSGEEGTTTPETSPPEQPGATLGETGDLAGTTVTITGIEGGEANLAGIDGALQAFTADTGIEIAYTQDFGGDLEARVDAGDPPDIALFSQPIVIADYARSGDVLPVPVDVAAEVSLVWSGEWTGLGEVDGVQYAVPNRVDPKSLVWYKPARFTELGYEVPQSWTELIALTEQAANDGNTPWCVGMESASATGWVFTDWVEDVVLRRQGAAFYDGWAAGEVRFTDPEVVQAFDEVRDLWTLPGAVHASGGSITATPFLDNGVPLASDECLMHRQAAFFASTLPAGTPLGDGSPDAVDVFYFPSEDQNRPLVSAGAWGAAFDDRPEVWVVLRYLASTEYANARQEAQRAVTGTNSLSGFLTAVDGVDRNLFTPAENSILDIVTVAGPVRYDASDDMPASVGAGTFWSEGTAFVDGDIDAVEATTAIDASWPR